MGNYDKLGKKYKELEKLVEVWRREKGYRATARALGLADHGSIKRRLHKAIELGLMDKDELVSEMENKTGDKEKDFEEH